jgi:hypothetical protein
LGAAAVLALQAMLDEGVYTPEQQAWIHNAIGAAWRYTKVHMTDACAAFNQAAVVAPDSVPGIAARCLAAELCGQLPG